MSTPDSPVITVLGECVADAFTEPPAGHAADGLALRVLAGGGPANTAATLARLGTPTRFLGRISDDVFGKLFRSRLTAAGVDLSDCVAAPQHSTLAVADVDTAGNATYAFFADGAADWQWSRGELEAVRSADTVCVHTGSLALVQPPGGHLVEEYLAAERRHATVSIDPNVRPGLVPLETYRERLGQWCRLADILRLSHDDLVHLHPGTPVEEACDTWHAAGARVVVVTLGEEGAVASLDGVRVTVAPRAVRVVDTVGAGDAFTAGLLHRLHDLGHLGGRLDSLTIDDLAAACAHGAEIAALACTVPGADPPLADGLPHTRATASAPPLGGSGAPN